MSYKGIDVSQYQKTINWSGVKNTGVEIAILRAGMGGTTSSGSNNKDTQFENNYTNAKNAGLKIGTYWFFNAYTDPITQADYYYNIIKDKSFDCYTVLDVETGSSYGTAELVRRVQLFRTRLCQLTGHWSVIYANQNYCTNYLNDGRLNGASVWAARYSSLQPNTGVMSRVGWQYSSTGSVSGISGNVDLDTFEDGILLNTSTITATATAVTSSSTVSSDVKAGADYLNNNAFVIKLVQYCLNACQQAGLTVDGIFGTNTYNKLILFQATTGLTADGLCGKKTFAKFYELLKQNTLSRNSSVDSKVMIVQHLLSVTADGVFGSKTQSALQAWCGKTKVTAEVWKGLFGAYM